MVRTFTMPIAWPTRDVVIHLRMARCVCVAELPFFCTSAPGETCMLNWFVIARGDAAPRDAWHGPAAKS